MTRRLALGLLIVLSVSLLGATAEEPRERALTPAPAMTLQALRAILREAVGDLKEENGQWRFSLAGVEMALLTSIAHDRMRIVAPIGQETELTDQQRKRMLEANIHSALHARYATSNGMIYAAYIHPLSSLRPEEVRSALHQVPELVKTFGTTHSSGDLTFGSPGLPRKSDRPKEGTSYYIRDQRTSMRL